MRSDNPWETLSSKVIYKNPWMSIREDKVITPSGPEGIYGYLESKDSVMVVVVNEKNEVYIIHTFSYPDTSWNWELPGGNSDGEDVAEASKRELVEETGITANAWTLLGKTRVCNGFMTEKMATYLAQDLRYGEKAGSDDADIITEGKFVPFGTIDQMIEKGEINDGQSLTALYLARRHLSL